MTDAPQYRNQRPEPWENAVVLLGVVLVCVLLLVGASGCSPRIVEHVIYQRDTTYIEKVRVDSVRKRDSVFIREKGDSVFIYREHVLERWRLVHDTITRQGSAGRETLTRVETGADAGVLAAGAAGRPPGPLDI